MKTATNSVEVIRALVPSDLDCFFEYLDDHLVDNGKGETPLFQPQSRQAPGFTAEKVEKFRNALEVPVGAPQWRRAWAAFGPTNSILGHVDLRGHEEPYTSHRGLVGIGVHRSYRRRGLGRRLITHATTWALEETSIDWIDLHFVSGNLPVAALYESCGFHKLGEILDIFRIDGETFGHQMMT